VAGETWETGKVIYFFSWASQADDLSSMFTGYGFVGRPVRGVRVEWLRGRQAGVWFKSREMFFVFTKILAATEGQWATDNEALARESLKMVPKDAKACSQAG